MKTFFVVKPSIKSNLTLSSFYKIFFILFIFLYTQNLFAQSGWFWQNPLPQGNDLYCVNYLNENTAFACGFCGTILKTTNNGVNWQLLRSDSIFICTSVSFQNVNTGSVICTEDITHAISLRSAKVIKTTDGGISWYTTLLMGSTYTYSIEFPSSDTGYFAAKGANGGYVFKTVNGGENWITNFYQQNISVYNTFFVNNNTGFSCGTMGINKTTNGGLNWQNQFQFSGMGGYFNSIVFLNSNTGLAVGIRISYPNSYQFVLRTTNSGNNWIEISTGTNNTLMDIKVAGDNSLFVCGNNTLLKSTNSGVNWIGIPLNDNILLRSIDFISSNGLIAGNLGIILESTNNGNEWLNNFSSYRDYGIGNIRFCNKNIGFAIAGKNLLKTFNGGNNWQLLVTPSTKYLNGIAIVDSNIIFAGGGDSDPNSNIIKSTNGGLNWITQNPQISYFLSSIFFINPDTGFCCGSGVVSKTTNGGNNWSPISLSGVLKSIYFVNYNTGYVAGYANGYKTTDSGNSWSPLPQSAVNLATCIYFINPNTGFTTNYNMQVRKTTDGGITWNIKTNNNVVSWYLNSISFINNNTGYAAGDFGTILKTTDGGEVWYNIKSPTNNFLTSVFMTDTNECYITGSGSTILKTTNGGNIIGLTQISQISPVFSKLSQNYPNPFNPQTKIKFAVPKASFTKLSIYDLLGREVATLVNEELKPGTYEADWDASDFSSGVYFYKLEAGDPSTGSGRGFVETKKMVLMK